MSNQISAEIIPFRARKPTVTVQAPTSGPDRHDVPGRAGSEDAQARLVRALRALDTALGEQRAAVAAWRGALGQLRTTVHGLNKSVESYRGSLNTLDAKVASLRGEAQRLEEWADEAVSKTTGATGRP